MSNATKQKAKPGEPLSEAEREKLRGLVGTIGEAKASEELGIARQTIVRALAGVGVRRGSAVMIRQGLSRPTAL